MNDRLILEDKPGRTCRAEGQELLFFSGYNYLGVNHDKEYMSLILEGIKKYGWVFPSSRISNSQLSIYEECEAFLSSLCGSEDTVLLPSGFIAGKLATSLFPEITNAPGSHPAILRKTSDYITFKEWSSSLKEELGQSSKPQAIASDSLNIFSAELYDFSFLTEARETIDVVIDDSHGIGLTGKGGNGVSSLVPKSENIRYTISYSLSKSFGISGGAVSCSAEAAQKLRAFPLYTATTPVSPSQLYAFMKGQHIYQSQRERLFHNINVFSSLLEGLPGIAFTPGFPVFILPASIDERFFYHNKILISSFAYPDPKGVKLNRIVLNALHTEKDLELLAFVLHEAYHESLKNTTQEKSSLNPPD